MKILNKFGQQQLSKLFEQDNKLRNKAWRSLNPIKICSYYVLRWHRRNCEICRKAYTKHLAGLAGVDL